MVKIEHVNVDILEEIEQEGKVSEQPTPATIRTTQDKYVQKEHLILHNLQVADLARVESTAEVIHEVGWAMGYPLMLKSHTIAYDGRGNYVVHSADEGAAALKALGDRPLYVERWVLFMKELSVMVVCVMDS
jgi:phosphoribosylaminoimidazole carboxylase